MHGSQTPVPKVQEQTQEVEVKEVKTKSKIGKPLAKIHWQSYTLTAYCPCRQCSEGYGRHTATGRLATQGRTIAVDPKIIPYGSKVKIKGLGTFRAEDCGGGVKGKHIDIYFSNHAQVEKFGKKVGKVVVLSGDD